MSNRYESLRRNTSDSRNTMSPGSPREGMSHRSKADQITAARQMSADIQAGLNPLQQDSRITIESVQIDNSSYNEIKSILEQNKRLFNIAYINISKQVQDLKVLEQRLNAKGIKDLNSKELDSLADTRDKRKKLEKTARDLEAIYKFINDDSRIQESMVKKAMSRLANDNYEDSVIGRAANLIKFNPKIQNFYRSDSSSRADASSSSRTGKERAEPGPSQNTDNITQKEYQFFRNIPNEFFTDLSRKIKQKTGSAALDRNLHSQISQAYTKIKLFRNLYPYAKTIQLQNSHGKIKEPEAVKAALALKEVLNENFKRPEVINFYRDQINQYYKSAGLS